MTRLQGGGAPILAIPRVDVFVREQETDANALVLVEKHPLLEAIVTRFVVLETEVGDVVRERQQERVRVVVMHAEERCRFGDELLVRRELGIGHDRRFIGVGGDAEDDAR